MSYILRINDTPTSYDSFSEALTASRAYVLPDTKSIEIKDEILATETGIDLTSADDDLTIFGNGTASAARQITGFTDDGDGFFAADIDLTGGWDFLSLSVDNVLASQSRLPETGSFINKNVWDGSWDGDNGGSWTPPPTTADLRELLYTDGDFLDTATADDINNMSIVIQHEWDESRSRVTSIDTVANMCLLSEDCNHPIGAFDHHTYQVYNVRSGITTRGQWLLDRARSKLVYYPLNGQDMSTAIVLAPFTENVFRVTGSNISIKINAMKLATSTTDSGFGGWMLDGALYLDGATDGIIENMNFSATEGYGVKDDGSTLTVKDCTFTDMSGGGVLCADGGARTITNNTIENIGTTHQGAVGIMVRGTVSGVNTISHNDISNATYSGMSVSDDNAVIEYNKVYNVLTALVDGGGIYVNGRDGAHIHHNLVEDIITSDPYSSSGLYMDESSINTLVENNVCDNVGRPVQMNNSGLAGTNIVRNNIFIYDGDILITLNRNSRMSFTKNVIVATGFIQIQMSDHSSGTPSELTEFVDNVLFSGTGDYRGDTWDTDLDTPENELVNSFDVDPVVTETNGVYSFGNTTETDAYGIVPIDLSTVGVLNVTYFSYINATGNVVQQSTELTSVNITVQHQSVWSSTAELSTLDIEEIEANPNIIMDVWFNGTILSSGFSKSYMINFFPNTEWENDVIHDISDNANHSSLGTSSRTLNQQTGVNNLLIQCAATGEALSAVSTGQIAVDASGKNVDPEWTISGDTYTIEQTISGNLEVLDVDGNPTASQTQRKEARVLTHSLAESQLFISVDDGAFSLQPYTPSLPTGSLVAGDTASIGYADTVDTHYGDLVVHNIIVDPTIVTYNGEVVTHNGEPVTHNGE